MKSLKITLANAEFNCRVLGNGIKNVIAFHGFGQDGNSFLPVVLKNPKYTIYSFDLPFHGDTKIQDLSLCISQTEVTDLIEKLIDLTSIERFSIAGFSIGARLLFPILERYHSMIDDVWLLAPDGIKINFWYRVATGTHLMRYLFHNLLTHPQLLKRIGYGFQSLNLIDQRTLLFVLKSTDTKKKREQVFHIWNYLRKLGLTEKASQRLNEAGIPVYFVLGEKDKIITESKIKPFVKKIPNSKVIILTCDHQTLIEYFADCICNVN